MGVVGGDTEDGPACAQYTIPYLFIAEFAGGAIYIGAGMAVEDFEQAGASDLLDMVMVEGPVKVGVVNRGDAASADDRVDVGLDGRYNLAGVYRLDQVGDSYAVDVDRWSPRMLGKRYLFTGNHQRLLELAPAICIVEQGEMVVIAEDQKIIAVPAVPAHDIFGSLVAAIHVRMGMDIALVPVEFWHLFISYTYSSMGLLAVGLHHSA